MGANHKSTEQSVRDSDDMHDPASLRQDLDQLREEVATLRTAVRSHGTELEPYPLWIAWLRRVSGRWGLLRLTAGVGVLFGLWLNYTVMRDDRIQFAESQEAAQQQFLAGQEAALNQAKVTQKQFDEDRRQYLVAQQAVLIGTLYNRVQCAEDSCPHVASTRVRRDALVALFDLGEADFANVDLSGANLFGVNLVNADLSGATLYKARIGTDRIPGKIVKMARTNWKGVNLSRAIFDHAFMVAMILDNANLEGARGRHADLFFAHLTDATLSGADLSNANLANSVLVRADLSSASLKEVRFHDANMQGASLILADLTNALMHRADLRGVYFSGAQFGGTVLIGADLRDAGIGAFTDLRDTNLSGADLRGVDLSCWKLGAATLDGARLEGAKYGPHTTFPPAFRPTEHGLIFTRVRPGGMIGCLR